MYHAFYEKREFTTNDICMALKELIPLAHLESDQMKKLQNWASSGRIRLASSKTYIFKLKNLMKQKIFRLVADLRFSIFILLLISFCSIAGTIIEQDQAIEIYKLNYPLTNPIFGFLTWDRIIKFGFDHVYKTWWFFSYFSIWIKFNFLYIFTTITIIKNCTSMSIF